MNINKRETTTKYIVEVTDDVYVIVNLVNNKTMHIERIAKWVELEDESSLDYYAKVKYQRKIKDIHNLENEMEEFVLGRLDKMIAKVNEVIAEHCPIRIIK